MKTVCITNRKLTNNIDSFYSKIDEITKEKPDKIILREKDLSEDEYEKIAKKCLLICNKNNISLTVNKFINTAKKLNIKNIHLSIKDFIDNRENLANFSNIGVSIHSLAEALTAEKQGADYVIAGHIFKTDCKKNVPPRGIEFLNKICENLQIPVYAIGGINTKNVLEIAQTKAAGICLMSSLMSAKKPSDILKKMYINK